MGVDRFPDEILLLIFTNVTPYELRSVCPIVCHRWNILSKMALQCVQQNFIKSIKSGSYNWSMVNYNNSNQNNISLKDSQLCSLPTMYETNYNCPSISASSIMAKGGPLASSYLDQIMHKNQQTQTPTLLPRYKHATCYMDGWLYVFGGQPDPGSKLNDFWKLNLSTRVWHRIVCPSGGSLNVTRDQDHQPCPRSSATLVALSRGALGDQGPRLVLFGGHALPSTLFELPRMLDTLHVFYPEKGPRWERILNPLDKGVHDINHPIDCFGEAAVTSNTYRATFSSPPPTAGHSAAVFEFKIRLGDVNGSVSDDCTKGHYMLVFGGLCSPGPYSSNTLWVFDLQNLTWSHALIGSSISSGQTNDDFCPPSRFNHSHAPFVATGDWLIVGGVSTSGLKYFDSWLLRTGNTIGQNASLSPWWYWTEIRVRGASTIDNGTRILASPLYGGWPPNLWARSGTYVSRAQALVVLAPESPQLKRQRSAKLNGHESIGNKFTGLEANNELFELDTDTLFSNHYCCLLCHNEHQTNYLNPSDDELSMLREVCSTSNISQTISNVNNNRGLSIPTTNSRIFSEGAISLFTRPISPPQCEKTPSSSVSVESQLILEAPVVSPFSLSKSVIVFDQSSPQSPSNMSKAEENDHYFYELQTETEMWRKYYKNRKNLLMSEQRAKDRLKRLGNMERYHNKYIIGKDPILSSVTNPSHNPSPEPPFRQTKTLMNTTESHDAFDDVSMDISLDSSLEEDSQPSNSETNNIDTINDLSCIRCRRCVHGSTYRVSKFSHRLGTRSDHKALAEMRKRRTAIEPRLQLYYLDLKPLVKYLNSNPVLNIHHNEGAIYGEMHLPNPLNQLTLVWIFSPSKPSSNLSNPLNHTDKSTVPPPDTIFYSLNYCEGACLVMVGGAHICIPNMASHVPEVTADKVSRDTYYIE